MDKDETINLLIAYIRAIPKEKYHLSKAFLFGSYANDNQHDDSDIDLALVIKNLSGPLTAQIELMKLRRTIDLRIEPHPFRESDFNGQHPLASEILKYGLEIPV